VIGEIFKYTILTGRISVIRQSDGTAWRCGGFGKRHAGTDAAQSYKC
jgi:hypothetical protein